MGSGSQQDMYDYYDERASEYDEIYHGGGPASIPNPDVYKNEVCVISQLLPMHVGEKHIDMACGTGFWLPFYESKCSEITMIDKSSKMLSECSARIEQLGIGCKTFLICDDLLSYDFEQSKYDSALVGFFIGHLIKDQEKSFLNILKRILKPSGKLFIIESIWNYERAATFNKSGLVKRTLNDGREFEIYKRYFGKKDFNILAKEHEINFEVIHEGRAFIAAIRFEPTIMKTSIA